MISARTRAEGITVADRLLLEFPAFPSRHLKKSRWVAAASERTNERGRTASGGAQDLPNRMVSSRGNRVINWYHNGDCAFTALYWAEVVKRTY